MRDHSLRESSCYDNVMAAFLCDEIDRLKVFENPLKKYDIAKNVKKTFWTGKYFKNDSSDDLTIVGDANILPFWTCVIDDKKMMKNAMNALISEGLDKPFPLKYVKGPEKGHKMILAEIFVKDWEQNTIWAMMGMMFVDVMMKNDAKKAKRYIEMYEKIIEKNKNFLEVYTADGKPYVTKFYACDDSMLWACMYLGLRKKLTSPDE